MLRKTKNCSDLVLQMKNKNRTFGNYVEGDVSVLMVKSSIKVKLKVNFGKNKEQVSEKESESLRLSPLLVNFPLLILIFEQLLLFLRR